MFIRLTSSDTFETLTIAVSAIEDYMREGDVTRINYTSGRFRYVVEDPKLISKLMSDLSEQLVTVGVSFD